MCLDVYILDTKLEHQRKLLLLFLLFVELFVSNFWIFIYGKQQIVLKQLFPWWTLFIIGSLKCNAFTPFTSIQWKPKPEYARSQTRNSITKIVQSYQWSDNNWKAKVTTVRFLSSKKKIFFLFLQLSDDMHLHCT